MATALQRLRQGQGRCQQQLLSLLQWHQQAAVGSAPQPARGFAADQAAAVQFAKKRKGFENTLSELRKQWAREREEKEAARAAAEQAARWVAVAPAAAMAAGAHIHTQPLLYAEPCCRFPLQGGTRGGESAA